jgi:hypothetical protein
MNPDAFDVTSADAAIALGWEIIITDVGYTFRRLTLDRHFVLVYPGFWLTIYDNPPEAGNLVSQNQYGTFALALAAAGDYAALHGGWDEQSEQKVGDWRAIDLFEGG